jgi:hypothetical protein
MTLNVIIALLLSFTSIDIRDPVVHGVMADLLRHARFGMANTEEAAFLIRNAAGATDTQPSVQHRSPPGRRHGDRGEVAVGGAAGVGDVGAELGGLR